MGMTERIAILRTERKNLASLDIHADWQRDHPDDGSAQIQALDGSLEHDYFVPIIWNERNNKLVDGVKRRYSIEGSANLRSSDNLEQMLILNDQDTHDYHAAWIDALATEYATRT